MDFITILGIVASAITVTAYLPQVFKSWKTRETSSLSLRTYSVFCIGSAVWISYGIAKKDYVIIIVNSILICFQLSLLYLKLKGKTSESN